MPKIDPNTLTVKTHAEVAAFFGCSVQTVKQWSSGENKMPGQRNAWPLAEIVRWRFAQETGPRPDDGKLRELQIAERAIDVQTKKQKLDHSQGKLVNRQAAIDTIRSMFNRVRQRLLALPDELVSSLPAATRADALVDLKRMINNVLREFQSWSED